MHRARALLAVAFVAASGCVGSSGFDTAAGASSEDLLMGEGYLGSIEVDDWQDAEAGCDGRLADDVLFAIASAEQELIAVVEADGDLVCVDTVAAIEEELEEVGLAETALRLVAAFHSAVGRGDDRMTGPHAGDPDPEPNRGFGQIILCAADSETSTAP